MADILARKDGLKTESFDIPSSNDDNILKPNAPEEPSIQEPAAEQDGFNTILRCRWCGGKIRELYIPKYKDGVNGKPQEMIYNYEPCRNCAEKWQTMVTLIEVTINAPYPKCLPIQIAKRKLESGEIVDAPLYPTGRHVGVTLECAKECIDPDVELGKIYFVEESLFSETFAEQFKNLEQ